MQEEITKDEFLAYEQVRVNGVTNMLEAGLVSHLSGLDRETIFSIIRNYDELADKYLEKGEQNGRKGSTGR